VVGLWLAEHPTRDKTLKLGAAGVRSTRRSDKTLKLAAADVRSTRRTDVCVVERDLTYWVTDTLGDAFFLQHLGCKEDVTRDVILWISRKLNTALLARIVANDMKVSVLTCLQDHCVDWRANIIVQLFIDRQSELCVAAMAGTGSWMNLVSPHVTSNSFASHVRASSPRPLRPSHLTHLPRASLPRQHASLLKLPRYLDVDHPFDTGSTRDPVDILKDCVRMLRRNEDGVLGTVGMVLAVAAVDGNLQPFADKFLEPLAPPHQSRLFDTAGFAAAAAQSLVLALLQGEFCAWVGAQFCPPPPHVSLFEDANRLPEDTSTWPITPWLDKQRGGFGWRFSLAFASLQMPMVWSMRHRLRDASGLLRRHLFAQLSQRLCNLGATRAEVRAIVTAVDSAARRVGSSKHAPSHLTPSHVHDVDAAAAAADIDVSAAAAAKDTGADKLDESERQLAKRQRTNPVLYQLLLGTYDKDSPLSVLRGNHDVLEEIWMRVLDRCARDEMHTFTDLSLHSTVVSAV
jgi:hypothetical protein